MSRVLLIEPPTEGNFSNLRVLGSIGTKKANILWPPYDLLFIGGLLKKNDIDFKIIDADNLRYSFSHVKEIIRKEKPELVVFMTTAPSMINDVQTARIAKEVSKNIMTAAINLSMPAVKNLDNLLKIYPFLDIVVYGEAELPILNLIKANYNPKNVKGIYYKTKKGIKKNAPLPPTNFDLLGVPPHDMLPFKLYKDPLMKRKPMTLVCCSRGCINTCKYCASVFQRPVRYRSIESVIQELKLVESLGIKEVKFFDCTFTNNIQWVEKFLKRMIKEDFDITWSCDVRADRLPLKIIKLMKKAKCHTVCIGSDSSNQAILNAIRKNVTVKQIRNAVMNAKREGLRVLMYLTFGHPGETKETIRDSIEFAKKMDPSLVTFGIIVPVYNTEFYDYLEQNGYITNKNIIDYDPTKPPVYSYPNLSSDDIYKMVREGYREFYFRPKIIARRLVHTPSLKDEFTNFVYFVKRYVFGGSKKAV